MSSSSSELYIERPCSTSSLLILQSSRLPRHAILAHAMRWKLLSTCGGLFAVKSNARPSSRHQIATTAPRQCAPGTACLNSGPAGKLPQKSPSVGHYRLRQPRRAEAPNRREVEGAAASLTLLSLLPSIRHPQSFLPYKPRGVLACLLNASFVFSTSRRI